jgi:perosamine synthetase
MQTTFHQYLRPLRRLARFGLRRAANLTAFASGAPVTTPPFVAMTMDHDDVCVIREWFSRRNEWFDDDFVHSFQEEYARWNGSKFAFAFMGGRVALSACIHALNLQPGDEVIVPGYTCIVVANAFRFAGIEPVFVDIELDTYGLDATQLERRITRRTKAILLHHLYGLVCRDYPLLIDVARRNAIAVIEDCAHSAGAIYHDQKVGNLGDVAFYSSEHSKAFTTYNGGLATTNDPSLSRRLAEYHRHSPYPDDDSIDALLHNLLLDYYAFKHRFRWFTGDLYSFFYGHKRIASTSADEEKGVCPAFYRRKMPAPIAAVGRNQIAKLDRYNERRRQTARKWDAWCDAQGYRRPLVVPNSEPVYLRYPVLVEPDKKLNPNWSRRTLCVDHGVWFKSHLHPVEGEISMCPNATTAVRQCINLPTLCP